MQIGRKQLRRAWDNARDDASLDRRDCVVFLVKARMPRGAAEAGYYRPGGPDVPHDHLIPSILRRVPPDLLDRYQYRHRVAIWAEIPSAPYCLLDPLLRHELEHASQYERYGRPYSDLDGYLREVWGARKDAARYLQLPSEREANLAAATYAHAHLNSVQLLRLLRRRRYRQLVDVASCPLEDDSVSLTVAALRAAGERFLPQCDADQRRRELEGLERRARDWPPGFLTYLRDEEPHDLVVVRHPYEPT